MLVAPSQKIAANMSKEEGLICFSTSAGKTGELGKYIEVLNTHGFDPMYYDRLLKGDIGAIVSRSNGDYLVIYDIVGKNSYENQYLIGVIRKDEGANVYQLITNYSVSANQLSKEFFGKVTYLRQPTKTAVNKGFVNSLLRDMGR